MRIFDEIWGNVIAAVVVSAMTTILQFLATLEPVYVFIIWFFIFLISFRVLYLTQRRKLEKRLNIQRERFGKLEEVRMKLREPQRVCLGIPKLLWDMNEIAVNLVKEQKIIDVPREKLDKAKMHQKFAFSAVRTLAVVLVLRNMWIGKLFKLNGWANKLILDLSSVLKELGLGGLMVEENDAYEAKLREVQSMMLPLPARITNMINANILLSKSLSTAYIIDFADPVFKKWNISMQSNFMLRFRYWADGTNILLMRSYGNITESIENYLVGK